MQIGTLFIVPTPIGNLEDMTLRAIRVLKEADVVLAEDTRTSSKLLKHFEIQTQMESFHAFNEHKAVDSIMRRLESGIQFAQISDAGTPGLSDPGFLLVREARKRGIPVVVLPGANALIPAVVGSGFPMTSFIFEGFLPIKKGRRKTLERLAQEQRTIVLYESPHKIQKTLTDLNEFFPLAEVCVARELSKIHETYHFGTPSELIETFSNRPKGEMVIVIFPQTELKNPSDEE